MPWASLQVNTPMLETTEILQPDPSQDEQDHSTIMRIFMSILGICSHMTLKDKVECQDKLTRALSKAAARLTQVCSGRPSMQVPPDRNGWFQPWGILHEPLLLCSGRPKAPRSSAQLPPGLQKFCGCKTLELTPSDGAFLQVLNP